LRQKHVKLADHLTKLDVGPSILGEAIVHALGSFEMNLAVDLLALHQHVFIQCSKRTFLLT
jgi:hypothetical protein